VALVASACAGGGAGPAGFGRAEIVLGGERWPVAVADDPAERAAGLSGVEGLGEVRGMLFAFPEDTTAAFWMKGTLLALDVAFFAADGSLVGRAEMVPCASEPCPTYSPGGPYRYALEVPAGGLDGMAALLLDPSSLPSGR